MSARLASMQAELSALTQQQERQAASQTDVERERARREATLARSQDDLIELQRRVAGHNEALRSLEGRRQIFDSMLREREAMLDERDVRLREAVAAQENAVVELAAALARATEAERLLALRPIPEPPPPAPAGAPEPDPELHSRITTLEAQLAEYREAVRTLQEQLQSSQDEREALRGELERAPVPTADAPPAPAPVPTADAPPAPAPAAAAASTPPAVQDGARLLVRTEGDAGIVHVLGRRTTIGRTPDNDLRIEAEFISRHHAVVLVGAERTVVEDLNSTNGVFVNDVKVTRHELSEGDLVTIGQTSFRYVVKPGVDQ